MESAASNGLDTSVSQPVPANPQANNKSEPAAKPQQSKPKTPPVETPESLDSMKKMAHLKFEEAGKLRKQAEADKAEAIKARDEALAHKKQIEEFIKLAETDPRKLERLYGKEKAKEIAERLLFEMYKDEALTPEQIEERNKRQAEADELAQYRKEKKEREENELKTKREAQIDEQAKNIDSLIVEGITEYGLQKTPRVVKRLAEYLDAQLDNGLEFDVPAAIVKLHEDRHYDVVDYLESTPMETLIEEVPTLINKVREFDMKANAKVPSFKSGFQKPQTEDESLKQPEKKQSIDEFFKSIG